RTKCTRTRATSASPPAASYGTVSASAFTSFPAKSGPKTVGPRIAPKTEPNNTYEIPRARRAGGYMSPAAVRMRSEIPLDAPTSAKPAITVTVELVRVARAVSAHPPAPRAKPAVITGVRPTRSIRRPAGHHRVQRIRPHPGADRRDTFQGVARAPL